MAVPKSALDGSMFAPPPLPPSDDMNFSSENEGLQAQNQSEVFFSLHEALPLRGIFSHHLHFVLSSIQLPSNCVCVHPPPLKMTNEAPEAGHAPLPPPKNRQTCSLQGLGESTRLAPKTRSTDGSLPFSIPLFPFSLPSSLSPSPSCLS